MLSSSEAQANETLYLNESKKLLQQIGETASEATDALNKFDLQTNSDKICMLTIGNNFARDLEHTLNNLQRTAIDNYKEDDYSKNLKDAVQQLSIFSHSIQVAFGNDLNNLKLETINCLQNLGNKLNPLLDNIVQEYSPYSSKWVIVDILDYLYIAIEKIILRLQLEHLEQAELENAVSGGLEATAAVFDKLTDKENLLSRFYRISQEYITDCFRLLKEINTDVDHYDDMIRDLLLNATNKISDAVFDFDRAIRGKYGISQLALYAKLCTMNMAPGAKAYLDILKIENLQDLDGNIRNFVLSAMVNGLGCEIRFASDCERIL